MTMENNRGRRCVCGNYHGVAENGYNGVTMWIAADAVWFLKKNHRGF